MHFGLSQEQEMIVSTVRSFVENEIYPHEAEVERTGEVPHDLGEEIKRKVIEMGFYACNFPEEVGGAGLSHLDFTLVERELGRGSMALTHFFGRPQNILMACNDEQRERYLLPAVRGERMDALAMTEPDAGSDVRGMKCTALRDGGDWVINGSKHFISGAEHADFFIVFIATGVDETPKGPKKRITTFLVDRGTPGFEVRDGYASVSHRGYKNCILDFSDCRLPDAQVLGAVDGGFAVMNEWLYATRLTVAAFSVGRARRCFDYALNYAAERKQFGQPIGKFQGVGFQIADMVTNPLKLADGGWFPDRGYGHRNRCGGLADPFSRLAARPRDAVKPRDRVRQALCLGDAGPGDGHDLANLRRHGADGRFSDRAVLAGCAGGAHLGRYVRDPATHHQPRSSATPGGLNGFE